MKAYSLNIGLTNRCNSKCMFCPVSRTKIQREDMPLDVAERIIKEADIERHVSLALFGESTLYKDLPAVIRMVKEKKLLSILYTNGLFDEPEKLAIAGLDKIIFSLDAFTKEEYIEFKGVDGFDKVNENIRKMEGKLHVTVQYADLDYKNKRHYLDKLPPANKIKMGRYVTWGGEVDYHGTKERKIREKKPCLNIFRYLNVASNGDVVMCCFDYNHLRVMGNVNNENIMDIWNGKEFRALRKEQENGVFNDICLNCENENYYNPH